MAFLVTRGAMFLPILVLVLLFVHGCTGRNFRGLVQLILAHFILVPHPILERSSPPPPPPAPPRSRRHIQKSLLDRWFSLASKPSKGSPH